MSELGQKIPRAANNRCPGIPQKRTFTDRTTMSVTCLKRHHASAGEATKSIFVLCHFSFVSDLNPTCSSVGLTLELNIREQLRCLIDAINLISEQLPTPTLLQQKPSSEETPLGALLVGGAAYEANPRRAAHRSIKRV